MGKTTAIVDGKRQAEFNPRADLRAGVIAAQLFAEAGDQHGTLGGITIGRYHQAAVQRVLRLTSRKAEHVALIQICFKTESNALRVQVIAVGAGTRFLRCHRSQSLHPESVARCIAAGKPGVAQP
jgi:hypothetical protein